MNKNVYRISKFHKIIFAFCYLDFCQKYQATLHILKDCKQEGLTEPRDPKRVKKLVSLARSTKRAELKYRIAVNSAENKLSLLQRVSDVPRVF